MQNKHIKFLLFVAVIAFIVPQIALAVWWNPFSWGVWNNIFHKQNKNNVSQQNTSQQLERVNSMKISYIPVPAEQNSSDIFKAADINVLFKSKEDRDFLDKYFSNFSESNLPTIAESKNILAKYKNILTALENGVNKKYYQCSIYLGNQQCNLTAFSTYASRLAALNSFILMKEGKTNDAQQYALKISKFGRMVTANAYEMITLIEGWTAQKIGYQMINFTGATSQFTKADLNTFIQNLRAEHKQVMKSEYTRNIAYIDSITNKKLSVNTDPDSTKIINEYISEANNVTWKPDIVKNWFYDSLQIVLSNIDLPCGSTYQKSSIDIGFNVNDTSETDNFLGKTFYTISYVELDNYNKKRCEIESLISSLLN